MKLLLVIVALLPIGAFAQGSGTTYAASEAEEELDAAVGAPSKDYTTFYEVIPVVTYSYYWPCSLSSSEEICLSSLFASMEGYLYSIDRSLVIEYSKIVAGEKREHYYLLYETSFVYDAELIGGEVRSAVDVVRVSVHSELYDLVEEKKRIYVMYDALIEQADAILAEIDSVESDIYALEAQYVKIEGEHLSLKTEISALVKAKSVVVSAYAQVEHIISKLYYDIDEIQAKLYMLYKRQEILYHYEYVISEDIANLNKDGEHFKAILSEIAAQEDVLLSREENLQAQLEVVVKQIKAVDAQYESLYEEWYHLFYYYKELVYEYYSVQYDVSKFYYAYSEFSCEESMLYYECVSGSTSVPSPAPVLGAI